jgi:ATP-dependent Lhr-like helicase
MAEWLRRLGDLAASDLEGPMAAFLEELEADGRAVRLELPGCREPQRWVLSEERDLYRQAFGLMPAEPEQRQTAAAIVLARYLATHALVSLRDVLDRYPFEETWARQRLEEWAMSGRVVAVPAATEAEPLQWSAPENLEQVQRGSLALLRREVATCPAPQFVDFVGRWQHLHPDTRQGSADGLAEVLGRLEGVLLPAELWERTALPARVPGYQPRWLDEQTASGEWLWVGQGEGPGPGALAFVQRGHLGQWTAPSAPDTAALHGPAERVLECLRTRGALFVPDLAQETGQTPGTVRAALWTLARLGAVTNDRFDVVRRGEEPASAEPAVVGQRSEVPRPGRLPAMRRASLSRPEGRWAVVSWGGPDAETQALHCATILLRRYGIVARELAVMDPWMPPWRVLYEVLSRMELAGDVRRGYFVEGLSGAQFALPEAARLLQELSLPADGAAPMLLTHSLDPANLYGAGAPLDIALLDGGTRPLSRRLGNWLVLRSGKPVLIAEQQGKRLTALASASRDDVAAAVGCLPAVLDCDQGVTVGRKLTVSEWNGQPVTATEGRELLEAVGFVRDYQSMTLYAAWR